MNEPAPKLQPSQPPPRPPGGSRTARGADDADGPRRRKETVRISLPPKVVAVSTTQMWGDGRFRSALLALKNTTRHVPLILGLLLISVLTVHEVYGFFDTNEGIRYFASKPRRLLNVMALGLAGGIVALCVSRLASRSQRRLKLAALGGFGVLLTTALAFLTCRFASASTTIREAGNLGSVITVLVSLLMAAGLVWLEFRRVWRST